MPETMRLPGESPPETVSAARHSVADRRRSWWKRRPGRAERATPEQATSGCRCRNPYGELLTSVEEVVLDVRELPLEGQIGRTLERMEVLPAGQRLRLVNALIPWPLFAMLDTRGYRYRLVGRKQGDFHVLIWSLAPPA